MRTPRDAIYDELLILRWRRGDRTAIDELLRRWDRRLLYYIRRIVQGEEDAWDVLQRTWLQVVRKLASLREPRKFPAWLYTTARNAAFAQRRESSAADKCIDTDVRLDDLPHAEIELHGDDTERVGRALSELSQPHREALTLLFLQDLSIEEIAQVVGISPGTVKSRVHYAKLQMRAILDRMDGPR